MTTTPLLDLATVRAAGTTAFAKAPTYAVQNVGTGRTVGLMLGTCGGARIVVKAGKQSAMLRKLVEAAGLPTRNGDYRGGTVGFNFGTPTLSQMQEVREAEAEAIIEQLDAIAGRSSRNRDRLKMAV